MPRISVTASTETAGSISVVFLLLKDSTTWPRWAALGSCTMKAWGRTEPHGVGAVRGFTNTLFAVTEEITEIIPNRRIAYVLKSGLPLTEYRAVIDLTSRMDGGCVIIWQASFQPSIPYTGWYFSRMIQSALNMNVKRLGRVAANNWAVQEIFQHSGIAMPSCAGKAGDSDGR